MWLSSVLSSELVSPNYIKMIDLHRMYCNEDGQAEICNKREGHIIKIWSRNKEGGVYYEASFVYSKRSVLLLLVSILSTTCQVFFF